MRKAIRTQPLKYAASVFLNFNISLISYKKSNVYMFVFTTTNENSTLPLEFEI